MTSPTSQGLRFTMDGPHGSGKTSITGYLALLSGCSILDTGLTFRAIALLVYNRLQALGVPSDSLSEAELRAALSGWQRRIVRELPRPIDGAQELVTIDGTDVTDKIFDESVEALHKRIAAIPQIRDEILQYHRQLIETHRDIIIIGRDGAETLLPDGQHIFLWASQDIRDARSRHRAEVEADSGRKRTSTGGPMTALDEKIRALVESEKERSLVLDTSALSPADVANRCQQHLEANGFTFGALDNKTSGESGLISHSMTLIQALYGDLPQTVKLPDGSEVRYVIGPGDDASGLQVRDLTLTISTDGIRGTGFHLFKKGLLNYRDIGYYLVAANVSDIAAMGSTPVGVHVVIRYPKGFKDRDFIELMHGIMQSCRDHGVPFAGADSGSTGNPELEVSATAEGISLGGRELTRGGAKPGDVVCLSGPVGAAWAALSYSSNDLHFLSPDDEQAMLEAWKHPHARVEFAKRLSKLAYGTSCQDTSDGVRACLSQIGKASHVSFRIFAEATPIGSLEAHSSNFPIDPLAARVAEHLGRDPVETALDATVDFQLVFTVHPAALATLRKDFEAVGLDVYPIGLVTAEVGNNVLVRPDGTVQRIAGGTGWDHTNQTLEQMLGMKPPVTESDKNSPEASKGGLYVPDMVTAAQLGLVAPPRDKPCDFCPKVPNWQGTEDYRDLYGVPQIVPTPGMPRDFYMLSDIQSSGHFLFNSIVHHMSGGQLPRDLPLQEGINWSIRSIRSQYGYDVYILAFENAPGFINGEPVACGGCHTDHFHVHFKVIPKSAVPTPEKMKGLVEGRLSRLGWNNPSERRVDGNGVLSGIGDIAGTQPYLHWAIVSPDDSVYASTYVRKSTTELVESRLMHHLITEDILNDHRREIWDGASFSLNVSPGHRPTQIGREILRSVALQRSQINSVTLDGSQGLPGLQLAVVLNGLTGTGNDILGRQLASHFRLEYVAAEDYLRALTLVANQRGVNIFDARAVADLVASTQVVANTDPIRPPGSWAIKIDGWPVLDHVLAGFQPFDLGYQPAAVVGQAAWIRSTVCKKQVVIASYQTTSRMLPPGSTQVVFRLRNDDPLVAATMGSMSWEAEHLYFSPEPPKANGRGRYAIYADGPSVPQFDVTSGPDAGNGALSRMIRACESTGLQPATADRIRTAEIQMNLVH